MKIQRKVHRKAAEELESKKISVFATVYSTVLLLVLTILQSTVLPSIKIFGSSFDVLLAAAIFLSIYTNEYAGALFGLIMGAVSDVIYDNPVPIMPVVFLFLCAGAGIYFYRLKKGNYLIKLAAIAIALTTRFLLTVIITLSTLTVSNPLLYVWQTAIPELLASLLVTPVIALICLPVRPKNEKRY